MCEEKALHYARIHYQLRIFQNLTVETMPITLRVTSGSDDGKERYCTVVQVIVTMEFSDRGWGCVTIWLGHHITCIQSFKLSLTSVFFFNL